MAIFYDVFEPGEKPAAFARLLELIDDFDGHMDTGILGARVIFHVLSAFDRADLAYEMITRPDYPSYGNWIARGATSLWEDFHPEGTPVNSLNHHFFGDISSWFIQSLTGIVLNPEGDDISRLDIAPHFVEALTHAEAFHIAPRERFPFPGNGTGKTCSLPWKRRKGCTAASVPQKAGSCRMKWGYCPWFPANTG